MYMAYTTNPNLPRVRMQAVELVKSGWSVREVAKHFGYAHNTVLNWLKIHPTYDRYGRLVIPTGSSKPNHHPNELSQNIIDRILEIRSEKNQCAEIIHWRLNQEDILISISSVKRTLKRLGISRFSKWKKWHQYPPRPPAEMPGMLVEVDAVHEGPPDNRVSAYALIDVNSRWAYAEPSLRINTWSTISFVKRAKVEAPFTFQTIQTDHGSEFSKQLTKIIQYAGISHRHSRVRTPTDNGHVERFIRTLQDECLHQIPRDFKVWQKEIPGFIRYYNEERPHMGLEMKTPMQVVRSY